MNSRVSLVWLVEEEELKSGVYSTDKNILTHYHLAQWKLITLYFIFAVIYFLSAAAGKDVQEIMDAGTEKLIPIMSGGGGGAAASSAPAEAAAAAPAAKPKEEEVDALEGGMDMFGGGGSDY